MAKKEFKKKNQIHNLIRTAFNNGMDIADLEEVKDFVDDINESYDLKPETLAYVVQSINRYALANEFRKANQKQTYPTLKLISVVDFCRDYGYSNIYTIINDELAFKFAKKNREGKTASRKTLGEYNNMKKAASLNNKVEEFEKDETFIRTKKFAESKRALLLDQIAESYWQIPNVESFIKTAHLDTNKKIKEVLDIARERKIYTSVKLASTAANSFNNLMKLVNTVIELSEE